jgi:hypothetical protein
VSTTFTVQVRWWKLLWTVGLCAAACYFYGWGAAAFVGASSFELKR